MPRVLIAASGSGGHLLPALYIANELKRQAPDVQIDFVGSGRPLEQEIIGKAGYRTHQIDIVGLKSRGLLGLAQFLLRLPKALLQSTRLLRQTRPQVVVGVGGYVSVLPVILSRIYGASSWIHEAEKKPGLANWFLSIFASRISCAFAETKFPVPRKTLFTGHPVRPELLQIRTERRKIEIPQKLLVLGGSQGAEALDQALQELATWLKSEKIELWHQCREQNASKLSTHYNTVGLPAKVTPFIHEIAEAYRWGELIVSRSGAGMVMELGIVNLPCILVPFPFAQAKHQHVNADILVSKGKALLVDEGPQFADRLKDAIEFLRVRENFQAMLCKPAVDRNSGAAEKIASGILGIISAKS